MDVNIYEQTHICIIYEFSSTIRTLTVSCVNDWIYMVHREKVTLVESCMAKGNESRSSLAATIKQGTS